MCGAITSESSTPAHACFLSGRPCIDLCVRCGRAFLTGSFRSAPLLHQIIADCCISDIFSRALDMKKVITTVGTWNWYQQLFKCPSLSSHRFVDRYQLGCTFTCLQISSDVQVPSFAYINLRARRSFSADINFCV